MSRLARGRAAFFGLLATTLLLALGWCAAPAGAHVGGFFKTETTDTSSSSMPCSWVLGGNSDVFNYGAPDTNAHYYGAELIGSPGTEDEITGKYPAARYFSFTLYDASQNPVATIYDQKVVPDAGSSNPFRGPRKRKTSTNFTVHVLFEAAPAHPAPNTLYAGPASSPSTSGDTIALREYLPNGVGGGVPLPAVSETTTSGTALLTEGACATAPPDDAAAPWQLYGDTNEPAAEPTEANDTTARPDWQETFGSAAANPQNAYLVVNVSHHWGQLVVFHFKAPTFPDTAIGQPVYKHHDVRYWSICAYDSSGEYGWTCTPDENAVRRHGWVTFVVSDPADRPSNATESHGVSRLPWGPVSEIQLVERNMLPAAGFAGAVQRIKTPNQNVEAARIMGDYYPTSAYCSEKTFQAGGWQACLPALAKRLARP